jgi:HEPN domain-containing protein
MSEPNEVLSVVRQWVWKAEGDLQAAAYVLQLGEDGPTDTVCFHAQQCIEKYIKALLVFAGIEFPWTHNLGVLIAYLPRQSRPTLTPEEQERLTNYATTTRYPGDYEPIAVAEARQAVRLARRARREIRRQLPRKTLRRPSPRKRGRRSLA